MKIIAWIGDEPNQKALVNKISKEFDVIGLILEKRENVRKITFKLILIKLIERLFLGKIHASWRNLHSFYINKYPEYPKIPTITVENINCDEVMNFTTNLESDLIIVSGTRLIKSKMFSLKPKHGILNLHTGLSPYIKGGPNCTNWCLSTRQFHLIGNTIMYLDEGIDSGNIIYSDFTPLNGSENLNDIHLNVMEHAHFIYLKSIQAINSGYLKNTPQSEIGTGKTYFTKEWNLKAKMNLILSLRKFKITLQRNQLELIRENIITIQPDMN